MSSKTFAQRFLNRAKIVDHVMLRVTTTTADALTPISETNVNITIIALPTRVKTMDSATEELMVTRVLVSLTFLVATVNTSTIALRILA